MAEDDDKSESSVHAESNSTAVGNFEVGGSVEGNITIGNTYIYNNAAAGQTKSILLEETLQIKNFEPETILVPAGLFWMGAEAGPGVPGYETPRHQVTLGAYRIGRRPVTNREFEFYVRQTGRQAPIIMGWNGQSVPAGLKDKPALGVSWDEAIRYCEWLAKETERAYVLPNEAQWEKASASADKVEFVANGLEWTCSLWGESRIKPDEAYFYPWRDDDRNDPNVNLQIRRVVRSCISEGEKNQRRSTVRYGRSTNDPGMADARHSFRVAISNLDK